jgi:hypothetical protein
VSGTGNRIVIRRRASTLDLPTVRSSGRLLTCAKLRSGSAQGTKCHGSLAREASGVGDTPPLFKKPARVFEAAVDSLSTPRLRPSQYTRKQSPQPPDPLPDNVQRFPARRVHAVHGPCTSNSASFVHQPTRAGAVLQWSERSET